MTSNKTNPALTAQGSLFPFGDKSSPASAAKKKAAAGGGGGVTNEVVGVVNGMRQRRMGGGDIFVSEMGLGTQRWGSADFNGWRGMGAKGGMLWSTFFYS